MRRTAVAVTAVVTGVAFGAVAFQLATSGAVPVPRAVEPAAGTIRTIAGSPASGGDGGPATDAQYSEAKAVAAGPGGIIVVDTSFHRVRIVAGGLVQRLAGTGTAGFAGDDGPAVAARLQNPSDAVSDSAGNVYVLDAGNQRIRRVAADGTIATVAGTGAAGVAADGAVAAVSPVSSPSDLAVDATGRLLFVEGGVVRRIEADGTLATVTAYGTGVRRLDVDAVGTAFVVRAAGAGEELVSVSAADVVTPWAANDGPLAGGCELFAASTDLGAFCGRPGAGGDHLVRYVPGVATPAAVGTADAGGADWITALAIDGDGLLVGSLRYEGGNGTVGENAVRRYTFQPGATPADPVTVANAIVAGPSTDAWGNGRPATAAGLDGVEDVGVATDGTVFVSQQGAQRVRAIRNGAVGAVDTVDLGDVVTVDRWSRLVVVGSQVVVAHHRCVSGVSGGCGGVRVVGPGAVPTPQAPDVSLVAVRPDGGLAVASDATTGTGAVSRVNADGTVTAVVAGAPVSDADGTAAMNLTPLQGLRGLDYDRSGNLYYTDVAPDDGVARLRRIGPNGTVATLVSSPSSTFGDLAVDWTGAVFFVDGSAVRRLGPDGVLTTVAGQVGAAGATGDGGAATAALLDPQGIGLDGDGNLYIAGGGRIRVVAKAAVMAPPYVGLRLSADMRGRLVVPVPGPRRGIGSVTLVLGLGQLCAEDAPVVHGTDPVLTVSLLSGAYGRAGVSVLDLTPLTRGTACLAVPNDVLQGLADKPASYAVQVTTGRYPGGAIRGQLRAA